MWKRNKVFIYLVLFFLGTGTAKSQSHNYQLFKEKGGYAHAYNRKMQEIISHFESGNTESLVLGFSKGQSFKVYGLVGKGDFFNA